METNELPEEFYRLLDNLLQSKEEELKAKDNENLVLKGRWAKQVGTMSKTIDSLTKEVKRLKAERESRAEHKRLNDEIAQLTKPKEELTKENERLRALLEKCRPLAFHSTLDPKQNWNNQATELLQEIDLLSQSTDKHQEKIAGRPEDFPWPVKEDKSLIQRIEERLGVVYLNDVYTWIQFKNALELESTDKP